MAKYVADKILQSQFFHNFDDVNIQHLYFMTALRIQALVCLAFLSAVLPAYMRAAQAEISELNYLREDSILWRQYEADCERLFQTSHEGSVGEEDVNVAWEELYGKASKRNVDLALRYATVPSGLRRLYMVRHLVAKDQLAEKLSNLPDSLMHNKYAGYIRDYISVEQKKAGDVFEPFECFSGDGSRFDWGALTGKHCLLIFDGLYCMGERGRGYLKDLQAKADSSQFQIVIYVKSKDIGRLKEEEKKFPQFKLVSDFQPEGSPMNILYNCQASPTCFMIDSFGKICFVTEGLEAEKLDAYLLRSGCKGHD